MEVADQRQTLERRRRLPHPCGQLDNALPTPPTCSKCCRGALRAGHRYSVSPGPRSRCRGGDRRGTGPPARLRL